MQARLASGALLGSLKAALKKKTAKVRQMWSCDAVFYVCNHMSFLLKYFRFSHTQKIVQGWKLEVQFKLTVLLYILGSRRPGLRRT